MKTEITLSLRTREVYRLFERKISGDRLFIEAILHKINTLIGRGRRQDSPTIKVLNEIEQQLKSLTNDFASEVKRYEALLTKKKEFKGKQINFMVQFYPKIIVCNPFHMRLCELIEVYDELVAVLKLLRLAGCFDTDEAYFLNVQEKQKVVNRMLSEVIFI